jgi:thiol-disulfide isomerase/thioredoxin
MLDRNGFDVMISINRLRSLMDKYSSLTKWIWGFCAAAALVLTACNQGSPSPRPGLSPTAGVLTATGRPLSASQGTPTPQVSLENTSDPGAYPLPATGAPTLVDLGVSSVGTPALSSPAGTPYPGPGGVALTGIPPVVDAYPASGSGLMTPTPAPYNPYPEPVTGSPASPSPVSSSSMAYPEPQQPAVTLSPTVPVSTPTFGLPAPSQTAQSVIPTTPPGTGTVEPTGTAFIVRAEMQATDPTSVNLASGNVQLVELFAFWSPTSKSMAPVIHALEDKYQSRIGFVYLDVDDSRNDSFKGTLGYRFPPQFFLLDRDGTIIDQWSLGEFLYHLPFL